MRFVYKFIGIGLLAFLALLIIPGSSATQSDDPSMYGMVTVHLKDESGKILFENQVHNNVVDHGTAFILNQTFPGGTWVGTTNQKIGLCVSNAASFSTAESSTPSTFNAENTIGNPYTNCNRIIWNEISPTSIDSGVQSFVADTAFEAGTTITGIGVCTVDTGSVILDCNASVIGSSAVVLLSVIDIPNTTIGSGSQLDVTYTFNLD